MNITDRNMRYFVACIVAVLLIGLGYASFSGKKQDEQFAIEQTTYNQALQHLQEGQYDQALPLFKQVEKEHSDSMPVKYYTGLTLANTGDWVGAALEFQKALDLNPYKVEDSVFMLQFSEVLINAGKLEEAKIVLERCQTLPIPEQFPDYQERVNAMLTQITTSS